MAPRRDACKKKIDLKTPDATEDDVSPTRLSGDKIGGIARKAKVRYGHKKHVRLVREMEDSDNGRPTASNHNAINGSESETKPHIEKRKSGRQKRISHKQTEAAESNSFDESCNGINNNKRVSKTSGIDKDGIICKNLATRKDIKVDCYAGDSSIESYLAQFNSPHVGMAG